MPADSGTPTGWISQLSNSVVSVHCKCPVELSAERFAQRERHPGRLDRERSRDEILASIRRVASFGALDIGPRIEVDTSQAPDFASVIREVRRSLEIPDPI